MFRIKRLALIRIFLFIFLLDYVCTELNSTKIRNNFFISSVSLMDSSIDIKNLAELNIQGLINGTKVDPELISLSESTPLNNNISIIIESTLDELENAILQFKNLGKIEKIINSIYFSGFSGIILNENLKRILNETPRSFKYIKVNGNAQITLKDSLKQLRIYPYLRQAPYYLKGDSQSSVAILDSGVDGSHPAFKNKIAYFKDFFNDPHFENASDYRGHGTSVGSIACGNSYNTTDEFGRTIISEKYYYDWSSSHLDTSKSWYYVTNSFNATKEGNITIQGNWFKEGTSTIKLYKLRLQNASGIVVKEINAIEASKNYNFSYAVNQTNIGLYSFSHVFNLTSNGNDAYGINITILLPEMNPDFNNSYSGVAPNCKIVALRCVREQSDEFAIIEALNWVLINKTQYNITAVVMSFMINSATIRNLADDLVEAGIVVACAARNDGPYDQYYRETNYAGSATHAPACADKVISVGAVNYNSSLTAYSSRGGPNPTGHVIKPDILAPGGVRNDYSYRNLPIYCADSNNGEYLSYNYSHTYEDMKDVVANDSLGVSGTSFAAPFVAGASQLIVEALGGIKNWNYTEQNALFVKNLLLLTATETNPNKRLGFPLQSPELNRGNKDVQEGYGAINPDAAIDAIKLEIAVNASYNSDLYSITSNDESKPYCWARKIYLPRNFYNITLEVPNDADFDFYLYNYNGNQYGEPVIRKKSVNSTLGADEVIIDFKNLVDGFYFVVVKGVFGQGVFNLSIYKSPTYFDKIAPSCNLLLPLNNTFWSENIYIKGNATDNQGIQNATFYIDTPTRQVTFTIITPQTNFSTIWTSKKNDNGVCLIYLKVFDFFENLAISNKINITIFNDNVPPNIEWLEPPDKSTTYGTFTIKAKITDEHSKVDSATVYIVAPNNTYSIEFEEIEDDLFECIWEPSFIDDGNCFIYIEAYDSNDNIRVSESLLIVVRVQQFLINATILSIFLMLVSLSVENRAFKKLLRSERFTLYLDALTTFLKKPSFKKMKLINPLTFFNSEFLLSLEIEKINNLIKDGLYKDALNSCEKAIHNSMRIKSSHIKREEVLRLLSSIEIDIKKKIKLKD